LVILEGALVRLFDRRSGVGRFSLFTGVDAGAPSVGVGADAYGEGASEE